MSTQTSDRKPIYWVETENGVQAHQPFLLGVLALSDHYSSDTGCVLGGDVAVVAEVLPWPWLSLGQAMTPRQGQEFNSIPASNTRRSSSQTGD